MVLNKKIIVFDIGGTWTRTAIFNCLEGTLSDKYQEKTENYLNQPYYSIDILQSNMVETIIERVNAYLYKHNDVRTVSISFGAAVNSHSGLILNAGQIWGPGCTPFAIIKELENIKPSIHWLIVNDITAALLSHVMLERLESKKVALYTVSTGVGCRIYDGKLKNVPVEPEFGIQGEIGHIPIKFDFFGTSHLNLYCDCGGLNHLNAFGSGRGLEKILKCYDDNLNLDNFCKAVKNQEVWALELLGYFTKPLAETIIQLLSYDPLIDKILITGGCAKKLHPYYFNALIENLDRIGLYQITNYNKDYFKEKLFISSLTVEYGLIGAGYFAYLF